LQLRETEAGFVSNFIFAYFILNKKGKKINKLFIFSLENDPVEHPKQRRMAILIACKIST